MPLDTSLTAARAGVSMPLTTIAQGFRPGKKRVMPLLFPLVETATYGGTILSFDDSAYEDVDDARADDTPYPELKFGYEGKPYKLDTKGLQVRIGDKRRREMGNLKINWGKIATDLLMDQATLKHEIQAAAIATTVGNYATANRVTLTAGNQFNDSIDPLAAIQVAKTVISDQADEEPNIGIIGRDVYDAFMRNPFIKEHTLQNVSLAERTRAMGGEMSTSVGQVSLQMLAALFGLERLEVCNAKRLVNGVKTRVFGKHMVLAYTNSRALSGSRLPYQVNGSINSMEPAMGYTFVMEGNPLMYTPHRDEDRKATVYTMDFDRQIAPVGVDAAGKIIYGYLIANAVA